MDNSKNLFFSALNLIGQQISEIFNVDDDLVDDELMDVIMKNPSAKREILEALDKSSNKEIKIEINASEIKII